MSWRFETLNFNIPFFLAPETVQELRPQSLPGDLWFFVPIRINPSPKLLEPNFSFIPLTLMQREVFGNFVGKEN